VESTTTISTIDRAEELLSSGDTQPALDMVRTLYGQTLASTDRGRALAIEAVCLLELERAAEAEQLIGLVMKEEGDDLAFVLAAGIEFSDLGEHTQAEVFLRNLCDLDANNHLAWFNLAINFGREERYLEAAEAYQKCLALNAEFTEAYVQRAYCLEALNDLENAAGMYRAYLERTPDDEEVWKSLGIVESDRKRFGEAYAAFEKALGCTDEPEDIWFNWAITAVRRDDEETLERCITKLQDLNPEGWRTLLARADYEEAQEHVWPAWELLSEALETALDDEDEEDEAAGYVGAALLRFANRNDMREHAAEHVLRLFEEDLLTEEVIEALQVLEGRMSNTAASFQVMLRSDGDERPVYIVYGVSADSADEAGRLAQSFHERCAPETWALHAIHQLSQPDEGRVGVYWRSRLYTRPPGV
jgi:tetratricopeptide (TPR) repeat protein